MDVTKLEFLPYHYLLATVVSIILLKKQTVDHKIVEVNFFWYVLKLSLLLRAMQVILNTKIHLLVN